MFFVIFSGRNFLGDSSLFAKLVIEKLHFFGFRRTWASDLWPEHQMMEYYMFHWFIVLVFMTVLSIKSGIQFLYCYISIEVTYVLSG